MWEMVCRGMGFGGDGGVRCGEDGVWGDGVYGGWGVWDGVWGEWGV